jgi:hypothetical protein
MKVFSNGRVFSLLLVCSLGSCSPDASVKQPQEEAQQATSPVECPADVICTQMFAVVSVTLKYPDNRPVLLDSYQIIQPSTGADKTPAISAQEKEMYRNMGVYPITTDAYQKELVNQKQEVTFIGIKEGKEIISRKFTLGADCCHVKLIAGELEITVPK